MKILFDFWTFFALVIAVMIPAGLGFICGYYARMKDEKLIKSSKT